MRSDKEVQTHYPTRALHRGQMITLESVRLFLARLINSARQHMVHSDVVSDNELQSDTIIKGGPAKYTFKIRQVVRTRSSTHF